MMYKSPWPRRGNVVLPMTTANSNGTVSSNGNKNTNNESQGSWQIEQRNRRDGACLACLPTVDGLLVETSTTLTYICTYISTNPHNPIPGSGENTFHDSIIAGIKSEYQSFPKYLHLMGDPTSYATQQLHLNIQNQRYHVGQPFPPPLSHDTCEVFHGHYTNTTIQSVTSRLPFRLASPPGGLAPTSRNLVQCTFSCQEALPPYAWMALHEKCPHDKGPHCVVRV